MLILVIYFYLFNLLFFKLNQIISLCACPGIDNDGGEAAGCDDDDGY